MAHDKPSRHPIPRRARRRASTCKRQTLDRPRERLVSKFARFDRRFHCRLVVRCARPEDEVGDEAEDEKEREDEDAAAGDTAAQAADKAVAGSASRGRASSRYGPTRQGARHALALRSFPPLQLCPPFLSCPPFPWPFPASVPSPRPVLWLE